MVEFVTGCRDHDMIYCSGFWCDVSLVSLEFYRSVWCGKRGLAGIGGGYVAPLRKQKVFPLAAPCGYSVCLDTHFLVQGAGCCVPIAVKLWYGSMTVVMEVMVLQSVPDAGVRYFVVPDLVSWTLQQIWQHATTQKRQVGPHKVQVAESMCSAHMEMPFLLETAD